ncbi:MAG: cysteine desulfurase family protein [Cycloclasticus sp.]
MIYFDHNATTPLDPEVLDAMMPFLTSLYGNPSSLHRHGRVVNTALEQARFQLASLVNVSPEQVVFTSGGTEANNLAISAALKGDKRHVLFGATEHPSVTETVGDLSHHGFTTEALAVDNNGLISVDSLLNKLQPTSGFISVMLANNESGVIQDIAALSAAVKNKGLVFHTDAVQAAGKLTVDFNQLGVNLMSLSSHKIYGPKGVGALIHDKATPLSAMQRGGGQEAGLRPGTENVAAIIGFGKAAELAKLRLNERAQQLAALQSNLEQGLQEVAGLTVVAAEVARLPNTSQILLDGIDGEMLLMQLDQQSIAVSSGSACSSNSKQPSAVLTAMAYPDKLALSAIRVSLGQQNTLVEVSDFVAKVKLIAAQRR